jgi:hypothetical protein
MIKERLIDTETANSFCKNFGWKHAAISPQQMQKSSLFEDTLFICLIRNPWRFISALHRRPYHYIPAAKKELEDFIQSPLLTNARDGLEDFVLSTPVDLWNKKIASYQTFQLLYPERVKIVYYEEVITEIDSFLHLLTPFCSVNNEKSVPISSTKNDNKTFIDYKKEVELYSPIKSIGKKCTSLITQKLNKRVFKKTIYRSLPNFKGIY